MKYIYSLLLILLFLNFSCSKNKQAQKVLQNTDSLMVLSNKITSKIGETLIPKAKQAVKDWKEYQEVDEFILKYYSISVLEALDNAQELSTLVQKMIQSIEIDNLNQLNVIARFNVLHNQTLRLADMANIPSISSEEVKEEIRTILDVFSAVNSKINTIYKVEEIRDLLEVDTETPIEIIEKPTRPILGDVAPRKEIIGNPERKINKKTAPKKQ